MKKILALCMTICMVFAVQAKDIPGNQDLKKESRFVAATFEQVVVNADFNVNLVYAISPKLEVEAESNLLQYIITEVKGKTLNISVAKKTRLANNFPITVYVAMPTMSKLQYTGNGDITVDAIPSEKMTIALNGKGICKWTNLKTSGLNITATKNFQLQFSDMLCEGSAKLELSDNTSADFSRIQFGKLEILNNTLELSKFMGIQTEALTIKGNAAGNMEFTGFAGKDVTATLVSTGKVLMSGTAKSVTVETSNAADFDGIGLAAEKAKVVNNGTADIRVAASASIDATITSSGSIYYKDAQKTKLNNTGSGQIIKQN